MFGFFFFFFRVDKMAKGLEVSSSSSSSLKSFLQPEVQHSITLNPVLNGKRFMALSGDLRIVGKSLIEVEVDMEGWGKMAFLKSKLHFITKRSSGLKLSFRSHVGLSSTFPQTRQNEHTGVPDIESFLAGMWRDKTPAQQITELNHFLSVAV